MSELVEIRGGRVAAAIDPLGAQLSSLQLEGREYLWQGDQRFWARRAPVLFPIVGSLRGGCAQSAAGPCKMGRHGIARNFEHAVVERAADGSAATFELRDSAETRAAYPYRFALNMTYAVAGGASLSQTFRVTNTGDVTLPFCVGGHPAFNVPLSGAQGESFEDYELRFAEPWTCSVPVIGPDGLMNWEDAFECPLGANALPLTHATFDHDALMFSHVPGSTLTLAGTKSGHGVRVDFPGFDYIGVWSTAGDAPFVALEPWTGHTTADNEDDVFEHKAGMTLLEPGQTFERAFTITLF